MQIAFFCHRVPFPPNKGEKIRAYHHLRAIASRHETDLFTLADDPDDLGGTASLASFCRHMEVVSVDRRKQKLRSVPSLLTRAPLTLPYFHSPELAARVTSSLRNTAYDLIFVYCSAMFQYVEQASRIPVVTDLVDVDSDKWRQYASHTRLPMSAVYARESRCLARYERSVSQNSTRIIVTTGREAALIRALDPQSNVDVIPVGVDADYFRPPADRTAESEDPTVVFTGDMSYYPNEHAVVFFAREVLPVIRQSVPGARFLIVGRNPAENVLRLRALPGVEVTGYVPDVRTCLARARVAVAPFQIAAGIQNKILEAMAFGLPVVATAMAVDGRLNAPTAAIVETAGNASELARKTVDLLRDRVRAERIGLDGRRAVSTHYTWDSCEAQLLDLLETTKERSVSSGTVFRQ